VSAGPYRGQHVPEGLHGWPDVSSWLFSRGGGCVHIASLHPRPSVRGEQPHHTRGDPVAQNTADLKQ
jgi:hypothetical protein